MTKELPSDYPERIRRLRIQHGLTQARLAETLGVSFATVNRWENGQSKPQPMAWRKIVRAEALGLDAVGDVAPPAQAVAEPDSPYGARAMTETQPQIDFSSEPETVRAYVEGERLSCGHLFNPAFATEISLIDPLPHQRIAVYDRMIPQPRLRFLLADDAGAGKTIMTGLYVREMLARRLLRRVLVVPPAGLVGNWKRELWTLFSLRFEIVAGSDARSRNPFTGEESDLLIVSVDTLAGERMFSRLQNPSVQPYDLVVFDEAHKLSAYREPDYTIRKIDRYKLAEALAGVSVEDPRWRLDWSPTHLLLLTATPHMGKDFPYYCLWRLLEPEALGTFDAFGSYPQGARRRHFIRRTKEEMIRLDGTPIYPERISDTLSYDLTEGEISEQTLYDETTDYIKTYYNRARIMNRSAARLAMSIFQRRLASSTYALMRSFERRLDKVSKMIEAIRSGELSAEKLREMQQRLDRVEDVFEARTADEESPEDGREQNEAAEDEALGGVVMESVADLEIERMRLEHLVDLAKRVNDLGQESKFEKLREILKDPQYASEKWIIFTEHRDTMDFLLRRLEGLGFAESVAQIHGGMAYKERDEQVEFFKRPLDDDGARFLVATDAAGEGINLQFTWLMLNYDVPWNPARLEQRMGRIHRYGQKHDPVVILNLVAAKTREGRVIKTLLDKLEKIRKELGSGKVFDCIGRVFQGVSIKEYMEKAVLADNADELASELDETFTADRVKAVDDEEQSIYGEPGDVARELPHLLDDIEIETYRRLLPGYVRHFVEKSAPALGIKLEGDLGSFFRMRPAQLGALDILWPILETYPEGQREQLTFSRPADPHDAIFLRPGEPFFEQFREYACTKFAPAARRGAVFVDPTATRPYMFHLALVSVVRQADPDTAGLEKEEPLEYRLVGMRCEEGGEFEECPVEYMLLLKGGTGLPVALHPYAATACASRDLGRVFVTERVVRPAAEGKRQALMSTLPQRLDFLKRGFDYQEADLLAARSRHTEKARAGDPHAKGELTRVKERQRRLASERETALRRVEREPELIALGEIEFLAHALVVPSETPEDQKRYDAEVEATAMRVAWAYEEASGASVRDVSKAELARAAGLQDYPGFDIMSRRPGNEVRSIEVKGRAGTIEVELTENEWTRACNLRERYWLYVVFDCASPRPRLLRVQDPFKKLLVRTTGGVAVAAGEIEKAAEE